MGRERICGQEINITMSINSVNDLSIEVHLLKKKHNIEEFYDNINKLLKDAGIEPIEADSPKSTLTLEDRITINYGKMIANTLDRDEVTLDDLDEQSLVKILMEPKNSLIKQYKELFKLEGVKLNFKDNAIKEIAQKAIRKKTGARGLRSILENILLKTMFDLPSREDIEEVIIDLGAAKGQSDPITIHSKSSKSKSEKTSAA